MRSSRPLPGPGAWMAAGVLLLTVSAFADQTLGGELFQNSNVNLNSWCYGYTLLWEAGVLSPDRHLLPESWTVLNTVEFVNAQVYSPDPFARLPHRVHDRESGFRGKLVSPPSIDVVARAIQEEQWGTEKPQGTDEERHDRYLAGLRANPGLLIKDEADMIARMDNLRGGRTQPLTVARFDPRPDGVPTKSPPTIHNIRVYRGGETGTLRVWDPNDSAHIDRTGTLRLVGNHGHLGYTIQGQFAPITLWWNNLFFTREYTGRGRDSGPVEWENEAEPDANWCCYLDLPDIDDSGFGYGPGPGLARALIPEGFRAPFPIRRARD